LFDEFGNKNTLNSAEKATLKDNMDRYSKFFPKVNAHQRIAMKFLDG